MYQKNSPLEFFTALVVIGVVLFSLGVVYRKNYGNRQEMILLQAEFDTVGGLNKGSAVKLNGVTVGTVKSIILDTKKNFVAIVTFSVPKELALPDDTEASVVSESLLGGKVMILTPGGNEKYLSEGDMIYRTQSPMNLEELIQKFLFSTPSESENKESDQKSTGEDKDIKNESSVYGRFYIMKGNL